MKTLLLVICMIFWNIPARILPDSHTADALRLIMDANQIPGISFTSLKDWEINETLALGVKNGANEALDQETVFSAASLSKPIFAYLVLQLVSEGLLDLDTPLATYFDYPDVKNDPRHTQVTAKMILSHTSGLPNWRSGKLNFKYEPGQRFSYSGEGFVWLQHTVEHLTGKPLEDLAQSYIFQPLGMKRSSFVFLAGFEPNFSLSYRKNGNERPKDKVQHANAAASLQTTSHDYALFLEAYLSGERLKPEIWKQMCSAIVPVDPKKGKEQRLFWGLGVGIQMTDAGKQLFQWGDNFTFRGFFTANVETGSGVVYFTNSENGLAPFEALVALGLTDTQPAGDWLDYE